MAMRASAGLSAAGSRQEVSRVRAKRMAGSTRQPRALTRLGITLSLLIAASPALGQASNKAVAEELFRQGQSLMQAGKLDEACPKLAESQRLDPGTGTLLNLGACHEKQGKLASAWAEFSDAAALAQRDGRDDRVQYAKDHLSAIEPKLSRLIIVVAPGAAVPGFQVKLDDSEVGGPSLGIPLPVDPGVHQIAAVAPGKRPWQASLTINAGPSRETITVQPLVDAPAEAVPAGGANADATEQGPPGKSQRIIAYGLGGLGVIGVGVGTAFGLTAISKNDDSNSKGCFGNECTVSAAALRRDARSAGTISTVAFVAGGAALAAGAIVYFTAPSAKSSAGRASARLSLAPGGASLAIGSAW
jgi:hypothetical protein